MNSKISAPFTVCFWAVIVAVFANGCATTNRFVPGYGQLPKNAPTYALAVAVHGGVEPTADQWNAMYARFSQALAARGMLLINDHTRAEHIIHLDFLPDPTIPTRGTAMITSIVANPAFGKTAALARTSFATSFASSRSSGYDPYWPSTYGYDRYNYNYSGNYYDYANSNYGYVSPTPSPAPTTPSPVTPPAHHRPPNPVDCPPGAPPYRPPPSFVGHHPHPPSHAYRPLPASDHTAGSSSRGSSSSGSSYDSSARSSYSSASDSSSSYSSGSSSSSSSYSAPAESSSYSSSANSGGSDAGSRTVPH